MSGIPRVVLLAGGGGGARMARGLYGLSGAVNPLVVTNPGDDFEHLGLWVCPDTDSVLYAVADAIDPKRGWGRRDETWSVLAEIERLHGPTWFSLGDRDIALHLLRHAGLSGGKTLTEVTSDLAVALGIRAMRIIPASDQPVRTFVHTADGVMEFQDYFVARGCAPRIDKLEYRGAEQALPNSQLLSFLGEGCDCVILGPSNPYLSIAPILAIPSIVDALAKADTVVAVSPIVNGEAIKGPLAKIMREKNLEPTVGSWVEEMKTMYPSFIDLWVFDQRDAAFAEQLRAQGDRVLIGDTVMTGAAEKTALVRQVLAECVVDV